MARIRSIKPDFFRHRRLYLLERELSMPVRMAFAGLWTVADREGRFRWEPEELKLDCLPYDDVDFSVILTALARDGFVVRYSIGGREYGCIPSWQAHQCINQREAKSTLPAPPISVTGETHDQAITVQDQEVTRHQQDAAHARMETHVHARGEGKGREEERKDTEPNGSGADAPDLENGFGGNVHHLRPPAPTPPAKVDSLEKRVYGEGKKLLGSSAGGLVTKLRTKYGRDDLRVLGVLELAARKESPLEYVMGILKGDRAVTEDEEIAELRREQQRRFGGRSV